MIINGTITQANQASEPTGQYKVRYQDVCITDQVGKEWYGRIGSKQGYQANTPIIVTVETKEQDGTSYNYFRKHNPQYPDQGRRPAPQNASQASSQPRQQPNTSKDRLIVAQVVYKALARLCPGGLWSEFDVWLMGNQLVLKRHVDLIMMIGAGQTPKTLNPNPAESKKMAQEFEADMEREQIDPNYEQAQADQNQAPF